MTIALDPNGSAIGSYQQGSGTSATITISTTNSNDIIIVDFTDSVLFSTAAPTSANLTFSNRIAYTGAASQTLLRYYAVASSPLTSEVITIGTLNNGFSRGTAFAVSGADTASPFDTGSTQTGDADPISITTSTANTMVIGYYTCNTPTSPGSGYTTINSAASDFAISEYRVVSSANTYSVTIGTGGVGTGSGGIIDAIKQSSAADVLAAQIWL